MYSTLEKAMILKSVDLFASIPSQELIRVAQIAEEEQYETDAPLCKEGDFGDCMYIIANGKVKVHKGDRCLLYTSPSPRDRQKSRMPSSA